VLLTHQESSLRRPPALEPGRGLHAAGERGLRLPLALEGLQLGPDSIGMNVSI